MDSLVAPDETSGGSGRLRLPTYAVVIIALTAGWCFARIMMVDTEAENGRALEFFGD